MFIQPRVRSSDGAVVRLDDVIGNRFAIIGWGSDPTFGLTPEARETWKRIGGCFVIAKPDTQLIYRDDVPAGVIAIGDVSGRMKDWFARVPRIGRADAPGPLCRGHVYAAASVVRHRRTRRQAGFANARFPYIHPAHEVVCETAIAVETGV